MEASGKLMNASGNSFFSSSKSSRTLGTQMKYGIYNDGSILRKWHADVDGALDPWSCFPLLYGEVFLELRK